MDTPYERRSPGLLALILLIVIIGAELVGVVGFLEPQWFQTTEDSE